MAGGEDAAAWRGERIYQNYCATCHGAGGDGAGRTARHYGPPAPRDFTRGVFRFRSTKTGQLPLRADLVRTVTQGVPGTIMPGWSGVLGAADIESVVRRVESFSPRFADASSGEREVAPVGTAPAPSAEAIWRGRRVYLAMQCWQCHGLGGRGDGPSAPTLKTEDGVPIRPPDFVAGTYKAGGSAAELYRTIVTGLDGTPMPSYLDSTLILREAAQSLGALEGLLGPQEIDDLRRYLLAQPTAETYYALGESEQKALSDGWRWDLIHYLRSLSRAGAWWRRLLGINPAL